MGFDYGRHIEQNAHVAGGELVIKRTRVSLRTVLASLAEGAGANAILRDFPRLSESDVRAAIAYAAASALKRC